MMYKLVCYRFLDGIREDQPIYEDHYEKLEDLEAALRKEIKDDFDDSVYVYQYEVYKREEWTRIPVTVSVEFEV